MPKYRAQLVVVEAKGDGKMQHLYVECGVDANGIFHFAFRTLLAHFRVRKLFPLVKYVSSDLIQYTINERVMLIRGTAHNVDVCVGFRIEILCLFLLDK